MKEEVIQSCPICKSKNSIEILNLDCGNLDNSKLYQKAIIKSCCNCGHIYNDLSTEDLEGLVQYYNDEYAPTNLSADDEHGDRPGSTNSFTMKRFDQLYRLISKYMTSESMVLDIGCAMGGFLLFLKSKGINHLYGTDLTEKYVNFASKNPDLVIKIGSAEKLPFEDKKFDLILMDQVMEHLYEPRKAFQEARRVLKKGGYFCIGVPNASEYTNYYIFDFYWFIMREHIQHFDLAHLQYLAESEGFRLIEHGKSESPMMSETMILPNLNAIFQYVGIVEKKDVDHSLISLQKNIVEYVNNDFQKLNQKADLIEKLVENQQPILIWGIGREFLYMASNTRLEETNIIELIDGNPHKQRNFSFKGKTIKDSRMIEWKSSKNSVMLITASAHESVIKQIALKLGFQGIFIEWN